MPLNQHLKLKIPGSQGIALLFRSTPDKPPVQMTTEPDVPIQLECICNPTDADWIDFNKIHQETATTGLTMDQKALQHFIQQGGEILAGRFNDRIIGVILATSEAGKIHLSQAAVRTVTQRRGVMHQLLHFIQRRALVDGHTLIISQSPETLKPALIKRGFQMIDNKITYNSN